MFVKKFFFKSQEVPADKTALMCWWIEFWICIERCLYFVIKKRKKKKKKPGPDKNVSQSDIYIYIYIYIYICHCAFFHYSCRVKRKNRHVKHLRLFTKVH